MTRYGARLGSCLASDKLDLSSCSRGIESRSQAAQRSSNKGDILAKAQ